MLTESRRLALALGIVLVAITIGDAAAEKMETEFLNVADVRHEAQVPTTYTVNLYLRTNDIDPAAGSELRLMEAISTWKRVEDGGQADCRDARRGLSPAGLKAHR
jgi:hypothetical protein